MPRNTLEMTSESAIASGKTSMMTIRPYAEKDKEALVALLRLNTPRYFDAAEEKDFTAYLDTDADHYFVVEADGRILGSGGINYFDNYTLARISWDIIHPDHQGKGIGAQLLHYRIEEIKNKPMMRLIVVRTSPLAYAFYQKLGFVLERVEKDFWATGFDLYQMKLEIHRNPADEAGKYKM